MNAGPMIARCFQHQHPEAYDRPVILPEFPRESNVAAEPIHDGANREGYVPPPEVVHE